MSKLHSIRARIRRISRYARLFSHSHQRLALWQRGRRANLLSTDATTWTNREGLGEIFDISLEMLVAKPAFRGEEIGFCEVRLVAMSCMGAELHVCLQWKIQPSSALGTMVWLTPPGTHWSQIRAPCRGVRRGSPSGNGGYILSPSDTMAARYGSRFTLSGKISASVLYALRIS